MPKQRLTSLSIDALLKLRNDIGGILSRRAEALRRELQSLGEDYKEVGRIAVYGKKSKKARKAKTAKKSKVARKAKTSRKATTAKKVKTARKAARRTSTPRRARPRQDEVRGLDGLRNEKAQEA